jgi:hypothetical protein
MRRYADQVEVRSASPEGAGAPSLFLWRGRLFVVRDVLGHWHERKAWWSSPAARRVHGEADHELVHSLGHPPVRVTDLAEEREVWRVAASPGRLHPDGVYDLCREPPVPPTPSRPGTGAVWRLVRVAD